MSLKLKGKISTGAQWAKVKWDQAKHKRDQLTGRFLHKPGTEEFKAETYGPGKEGKFKDSDIIKLHVTANPKKPGSNSAADFAKYKDGMTVGEFRSLTSNAQSHLVHDTKKGFITVHEPAQLKAVGATATVTQLKPPAAPAPKIETPPPPKPEPVLPPMPAGVALKSGDLVVTSKTAKVKPDDVITIIAPTNPKKPNTIAAKDFAKYQDGMTVAEFHAAVGSKTQAQSHILHDAKKGFIAVHSKADLDALKAGTKTPGQLAAEMKAGDKDLGVETVNPFTAGKNHDDFEATAAKLGLKTSLGAEAAAAPAPQPGAPKPATQPATPAPTGATQPAAKQPLNDNDELTTMTGNKYTVAQYKKNFGADDAEITDAVNNGYVKVTAKQTTLKDDDVVETFFGNKYTVAEYSKKHGMTTAEISKKMTDGSSALKLVPKVEAVAPAAKAALKDDDIIVTSMGNEYSYKDLKSKKYDYTDKQIQDNLEFGGWSLKPGTIPKPPVKAAAPAPKPEPPAPAPAPQSTVKYNDDDVITAGTGKFADKYTVKELKGIGHTEAEIKGKVAQGLWSHEAHDAKPAPKPAAAKMADDDTVNIGGDVYSVKDLKGSMGYTDEQIEQQIKGGWWKKSTKPVTAAAPKVATATIHYKDSDTITFKNSGAEYKVSELTNIGYSAAQINSKIQSGDFIVKKPTTMTEADAALAYKDEDTVTLKSGKLKTVKEAVEDMGYTKPEIDFKVKSGEWSHTPAKPPKLDPDKIPVSEYGTHTVVLTTSTNPYEQGTPGWHKYKSLAYAQKVGQSMSITGWYSHTTALTAPQKQAALKQMLDDGHIKILTPSQKTATQQAQTSKGLYKSYKPASAQDPNYQAHIEQVKAPGLDSNVARWNKAAGYQGDMVKTAKSIAGSQSTNTPHYQKILAVRKAAGLKFNSLKNNAVSWYTSLGYGKANNKLRHKGMTALDTDQRHNVKELDKLMEPVQEDLVLWRGIGSTHAHDNPDKPHFNTNNIPPPEDFTDMAFSSVSYNPAVARGFGGTSRITGEARKTVFKIRVPKGTKAAFIGRGYYEEDGLKDEAEVIIARGTRYAYISTARDEIVAGQTVDVVELEIISSKTASNL